MLGHTKLDRSWVDQLFEFTCGLYYKHVTIVNEAYRGVNKLKASLNDAARGVIYDRHMFIVQVTDLSMTIYSPFI